MYIHFKSSFLNKKAIILYIFKDQSFLIEKKIESLFSGKVGKLSTWENWEFIFRKSGKKKLIKKNNIKKYKNVFITLFFFFTSLNF